MHGLCVLLMPKTGIGAKRHSKIASERQRYRYLEQTKFLKFLET